MNDILKIYGYYVANTAISFEYAVPKLEKFKNRIKKNVKEYPYYAAVVGGKIVGYAYA
ncbi:MAG: GNAT family N-acetyltransferase [Candidatus Avigastranaerophilus sp.]